LKAATSFFGAELDRLLGPQAKDLVTVAHLHDAPAALTTTDLGGA
jgi:hypothetical protein